LLNLPAVRKFVLGFSLAIMVAGCESLSPPAPNVAVAASAANTKSPAIQPDIASALFNSNHVAVKDITQSLPIKGSYGTNYDKLILKVFPGSHILFRLQEGSGGFAYFIVRSKDGRQLYLQGELERHPADTQVHKLNARYRAVLSEDSSKGEACLQAELSKYYGLIQFKRFKYAYELRSTRSHQKTSYEDFVNTWSNNKSVGVESVTGHTIDGDKAEIEGVLSSVDLPPNSSSLQQAKYKFKVKLALEGERWRYDGGDFDLKGQPVAVAPPAPPQSTINSAREDQFRQALASARKSAAQAYVSKNFSLLADDGTFLGNCEKSGTDADSIFNENGQYGNKYAGHSIWNDYCPYGGQYAALSPFNPYCSTPPRIYYEGQPTAAILTANQFGPGAVHPLAFFSFVRTKCL
jgi:hypothetical protein